MWKKPPEWELHDSLSEGNSCWDYIDSVGHPRSTAIATVLSLPVCQRGCLLFNSSLCLCVCACACVALVSQIAGMCYHTQLRAVFCIVLASLLWMGEAYACVYTCGGQRSKSGIFFYFLYTLIFEAGSYTKPRAHLLTKLVDQWVSGVLLSLPTPVLRLQEQTATPVFFCEHSTSKLRSSCLCNKPFIHWATYSVRCIVSLFSKSSSSVIILLMISFLRLFW